MRPLGVIFFSFPSRMPGIWLLLLTCVHIPLSPGYWFSSTSELCCSVSLAFHSCNWDHIPVATMSLLFTPGRFQSTEESVFIFLPLASFHFKQLFLRG